MNNLDTTLDTTLDKGATSTLASPHQADSTQTHPSLAQVQARLQRLERLGLAGLAFAITGVVGAFGAGRMTAPPPAVEQAAAPADATFANIICRSVTVTDAQDMPRVQLDTTHDGNARILMRDHERRERFVVEAREADLTSLDIRDASGKPRIVLASLPDKSCGVDLADKDGTSRVMLLIEDDGSCSIAQADAEGRERLAHEILPAGNPVTRWQDHEGVVRLAALVKDGVGCTFDTNDTAERARVRSFARDTGECGLMIQDGAEEPRIMLGSEADPSASMAYWWDAEGELRLVAGTANTDLVAPVTDVKEMKDSPDESKAGWPKLPEGR